MYRHIFIESRIDFDKPEHAEFIKRYGILRTPVSVILKPGASYKEDRFELIEPLEWNRLFGRPRSIFEFPQSFTARIEYILKKQRTLLYMFDSEGNLEREDDWLRGHIKYFPPNGWVK